MEVLGINYCANKNQIMVRGKKIAIFLVTG
jgi:hypothetical protein